MEGPPGARPRGARRCRQEGGHGVVGCLALFAMVMRLAPLDDLQAALEAIPGHIEWAVSKYGIPAFDVARGHLQAVTTGLLKQQVLSRRLLQLQTNA